MADRTQSEIAVRAAFDDALIKLCLQRGHDPAKVMQNIDDLLTLEDRIEEADMMALLIEEVEAVVPEVGMILGRDTGLFYKSCVNMLYGTDSCGKTMLLQSVIMQELAAGNEVLYLDGEEGSPRNMVLRLQEMGINPEWGSRLHYFTIGRPPSGENRAMFADLAARCSLAVIDSAGEMMGMYGKDSVKDLETRSVLFEMFGRPLAKAGAAVVILDHIAKSSDGSQPVGSIRKRAAIDGAAYYMVVEEGSEWSKSREGEAMLICQKDRNGTYHRNELVARVQVTPAYCSVDDRLEVRVAFEEIDDLMEQTSDVEPPASKPLDEIESAIVAIVTNSPVTVHAKYLKSELQREGFSMTRTRMESIYKQLVKDGWLRFEAGGLRPAEWTQTPATSVESDVVD